MGRDRHGLDSVFPVTDLHYYPLLFKDTGGGADANGATHTHTERTRTGAEQHRINTAQTPTPARTEARAHPGRTRIQEQPAGRPGPHSGP